MTFKITSEQLIAGTHCSEATAHKVIDSLNQAMELFEINTPQRAACFIANACVETGNFKYLRELWTIDKPTKWQAAYEGRFGNKMRGDGYKYRGAGWLQITFKSNYITVTEWIRELLPNCPDFEQEPEKLAEYPWAAISAAAWWNHNGLNGLADRDMITGIRRRINGSQMLGLNEVKDIWQRLLRELEK